jgi:uncharacterized membrane protein YhiD involved in acid resistance
MFSELQYIDLFPLAAGEILLNLLVALLCGLLIATLYRLTYRGPGYSPSYITSIIILTLITSMVIMIIGNNLARAFGLVGAMSIIRFRTAVKDTIDIVFIFFALAAGMATGSGAHSLAIIGTVLIGAIILLLSRAPLFGTQRKEFLLQFSYVGGNDAPPPYTDALKRHCRRQRIVNVSAQGDSDVMDVALYVQLRADTDNQAFIRELQSVPGMRRVHLYIDDQQF